MARETGEALEGAEEPFVHGPDAGAEVSVVMRLVRVEQAYAELLERVRRYERERVEIKARLARLLSRLDTP